MTALRISKYRQLCTLLVVYGLYLLGFSGAFVGLISWPISLLPSAIVPLLFLVSSLLAFRRWRIPLAFGLVWPAIFTAVQLSRARAELLIPAQNIVGPLIYITRVLIIAAPAALLYVVVVAYRRDIADCFSGESERMH